MSATMRVTAWICIFTTALLGCTSTTLVVPEGEDGEKVYSGEIEIVITKDGTKYTFDNPQTVTIVANVIRGFSGGRFVAIPLEDVSKVYVRETDVALTILMGVGVVVVIGFIVIGASFSECYHDVKESASR